MADLDLVSYDGFALNAGGFSAGIEGPFGVQSTPQLADRAGSHPALTGGQVAARTLVVSIGYKGALTFGDAFGLLRSRLNPGNPRPRRLIATKTVGGVATTVWMDAVATEPEVLREGRAVSRVEVRFLAPDPVWRATTPTTVTHVVSGAVDMGMALIVGGDAPTRPTITLTGTSARTITTDPTKGWKYRKTFTVTNHTGRVFDRKPVRVELGNQAAVISAGKARADGGDLLVLLEGRSQPKRLFNYNTAAAHMWIVVDGLGAGQSRIYDVVYGNPAATVQHLLENPNVPSLDMGNSTNVKHIFLVGSVAGNASYGLWYLDRGTRQPTIVDRSTPGSWRTFVYAQGPDDFSVAPYLKYVSGSTYWNAAFECVRAREDSTGLSVGLVDKKIADGVVYHDPATIQSIRMDYAYYNPVMEDGNPTTKFRIVGRSGGAGDWEVIHENSNAYAGGLTSVATATYSFANPYPTHVGMAVMPWYNDRIPEEVHSSRYGHVRANGVLEVNLEPTSMTVSALSAESPVYDAATTLYLNRNHPPYQLMPMGGDQGTSRLMLPLFWPVVVDCEDRSVREWNDTLTAVSRDYMDAATVKDAELDETGLATVDIVAGDWFPIAPRANPLTNADLTTNMNDWAVVHTQPGSTTAWSRVASPCGAPGALQALVSANTAGALGLSHVRNSARHPVVPGVKYRVSADTRSNTANLATVLGIEFFDAAGASVAAYYEAVWTPVANTCYHRVFEAVAPATAATATMRVVAQARTASGTGTVTASAPSLDGNELTWNALDGGVEIKVSHYPSWH